MKIVSNWKNVQPHASLYLGSLESKTQLVSLDFFSNSGPGPGPSNRIRNAAAIGLDFHLHFVQTYYMPSVHIMYYTIICLFAFQAVLDRATAAANHDGLLKKLLLNFHVKF